MDFWAIVSGVMALFGLLAVSAMHASVNLGGEALGPPQDPQKRSNLLAIVIAILAAAMLAFSVRFTNFDPDPGHVALTSAPVPGIEDVRDFATALPQASKDPQAQLHLEKVSADLRQATAVAGLGDPTPADRSKYWASIESASSELQAAKAVDPRLAGSIQYLRVERGLGGLGETPVASQVELVVASSREKKGWLSNPGMWMLATFIIAGLFLISVIGIVVLVAVLHRDGKPATAKRWMRTYTEPLGAGFALVIGLLIALNPGLDHATTLWGAGVAGSGMGFWIKMSV